MLRNYEREVKFYLEVADRSTYVCRTATTALGQAAVISSSCSRT